MWHENSNGLIFTELQGAFQTSKVKIHVLSFTGAVEGILGADLPRRGGLSRGEGSRCPGRWKGVSSPHRLAAPRYWLRAASRRFSPKALALSSASVRETWVANTWCGDISEGNLLGLNFTLTSLPRAVPAPCPHCPGAAPLVAGLHGALKLWGLHRLTSEDPFRPQPSCDSVTEAARNAPVTHPAGSGPGEATACAHPLMARSLEPPTAASTNQVSGAVSRRDHLQQPGLQGEGRQAVAFLPC